VAKKGLIPEDSEINHTIKWGYSGIPIRQIPPYKEERYMVLALLHDMARWQ